MRVAWVLLWAAVCAFAQSPDRAAIRGQVTDPSSAVVAGASVRIENEPLRFTQTTRTDAAGLYSFAELPVGGEYRIAVEQAGFAGAQKLGVRLHAGETATIDVRLSISDSDTDIEVYGTVEGVRSDTPQIGSTLSAAAIEELPVLGRKVSSLPLVDSAVRPARGTGDLFLGTTLFVFGAGGRRQPTFAVDGATADDAWGRQAMFTSVPLVAVQELAILTNAFSPAYGWTNGGALALTTRQGTSRWSGEAVGTWRPPGIQARPPVAGRRAADRLEQGSAIVSGPVFEKTFLSASAEITRQRRDSTVTSPLAPQTVSGDLRQELALLRVDHDLSERSRFFGRYMMDRLSDTNPQDAVGGLVLPSAGRLFERNTYGLVLGHTLIASAHVVNDARAQVQLGSPITKFDPLRPSSQFVRPGIATEGESRVADLTSRQEQFADTISIARGAHQLKIGGDALHSWSGGYGQEFGTGYLLGQFTVKAGVTKPVSELTAADIASYTQSFGNNTYHVAEWLGSAYAQDNWKVRRDLTVDAGIRYDIQTFSDDRAMWSPRLGFAWNPRGDRKTVVRGSYGLYYSQLRANIAAGYRLGGPEGQFTYTASPGQPGFPADLQPITVLPAGALLPARDITARAGDREYLSRFLDVGKLNGFPDRLVNPRTQNTSVGVERDLGGNWVLAVDFLHQLTTRIDRPLDLNAPAPFIRTAAGQIRSPAAADATRPIVPVAGGFRRIIATVNDGMARYDGLQTNLTRRFARSAGMRASYTYSHAINTVEMDIPSQDPNDQNLLGRAERGPALLDQRHRAVVTGWYTLPYGFTFGTETSLASGRPYNITTGTDNNGDRSNTDRPVVNGALMGRNAGRGTPVYDVQIFAEREFRVAERARIALRAESFNTLNHPNVVGRNAVWGNAGTPVASFGQPLGGLANVDPGRQFQFVLRARF